VGVAAGVFCVVMENNSVVQVDAVGKPVGVGEFRAGKVTAIAVGHFMHDIFTGWLAPLLPLIIEKLGLSLALAGTLASMQQLPSLINPLLGALADRGKLRWLVVLAPSLSAAGMSLAGMAPSYGMLVLLLLGVGMSTAVWHTATPALVARSSGLRMGKGMSFYMIGGTFAYTVSPLIAVAAVSWWGLEGLWRLWPVALAASGMLYWQTRDLDGFREVAQGEKPSWQGSWQVLRKVLLPAAGIVMAHGFLQTAMGTYLPTFMSAEGASLWLAGASLALFELAGVLGTITMGVVSDRLSRRGVLLVALGTAPLFMLGFLFAPGFWRVLPMLGVGFASMATIPVLMALVQEYSRDHPATGNGLLLTVMFAGRSLIMIGVGAMADWLGLPGAFLVCALIGFGALPFAWRLPGRQ